MVHSSYGVAASHSPMFDDQADVDLSENRVQYTLGGEPYFSHCSL